MKQLMMARPPLDKLYPEVRWFAFLMLAIGLHLFEASLPSLGPWFKPGLANLVTLLVLVQMGAKAAFLLAIGRVVVGSLLIGTLFTPTFVIAMTGALAAAVVMVAARVLLPALSLVGISLLGALAHMVAQFVVVESLFIQQPALFYALPPLLLLSCVSGWINGALAAYIAARLFPDAGAR